MKDPAFLFYSQDFLTGITDLTMEERGQYITLLCLQHQKGALSEKLMRLQCGGIPSADVLAKFEKDENGNFFNKRLDEEKQKREKHSQQQRENAYKRWGKQKKSSELNNKKEESDGNAIAYASAMPLENEIENENEDVNKNRNEIEKTKKRKSKIQIVFPFNSDQFLNHWEIWKDYRHQQHKFKFASEITEQASLKKLSELAKGDEQTAIKIINQSLENGWKGFFELKQIQNENKQSTSNNGYSEEFARKTAERLGIV